MQDSFDARMQGQKPESAQKSVSSKGWMIAAIIFLLGAIALGVTEFLAYQEISKKDERIAELEKQQNKPEEEQKEESTSSSLNGVDLDGEGLSKTLGHVLLNSFSNFKISKDGKYLHVDIDYNTGENYIAQTSFLFYKALPTGEWKRVATSGNTVGVCGVAYSEEELEVLIDAGHGDIPCVMKEEDVMDKSKHKTISEYYNETYKK